MKRIAILGGGIIGVTAALHLQERGYVTTLFTHLRADEVHDRHSLPEFASLFPAACIVPHAVEMNDMLEVFDISQREFSRLAELPGSGVRWQRHYELSSEPTVELPMYARVLRECTPYEGSSDRLSFDAALGSKVRGWSADVLFAETPIFIRYLYNRYANAGGTIISRRLERNQLPSLEADVVVNCMGLWSRSLFGDRNVYPVRGQLMFIQNAGFPPLPDGTTFSYNYKPPDEDYVYDVYFFPRSGAAGTSARGWLLGGSREPADSDRGEPWRFPPLEVELKENIPAPIFHINRKILLSLTGIDIAYFPQTTYAGYRPARKGGVRLEVQQDAGMSIVHNYGHGGGGVALSWGSAHKVRELLEQLGH